MAFAARFDGTCSAACGNRIHPGDLIERDPERQQSFRHIECAPTPSRFDIGPRETVCGVCWLVKPCKCDA